MNLMVPVGAEHRRSEWADLSIGCLDNQGPSIFWGELGWLKWIRVFWVDRLPLTFAGRPK